MSGDPSSQHPLGRKALGPAPSEGSKQLGPAGSTEPESAQPGLYFFPEDHVTESELHSILKGSDVERRCWALSHLLRFAQWEDIWLYVTREQVRSDFDRIALPARLRKAWARMLKIEAGVETG